MTEQDTSAERFEEWCVCEMMGHRRLFAKVTEQTLAGKAFLRLDIPKKDSFNTQFYNPEAIYCMTPTTEEIVRKMAVNNQPSPVNRWEIPESPEIDFEPETSRQFQMTCVSCGHDFSVPVDEHDYPCPNCGSESSNVN